MLDDGEILYNGVKKFNFVTPLNDDIDPNTESRIKSDLSVKPNNAFISPYSRFPLPIGLWVYDYCNVTKDKGFKHWFYDKFATEPILISTVAPNIRAKQVESVLNNRGYFNSTATYNLKYSKRDDKLAKIDYTINVTKPWLINEVIYPTVKDTLTAIINDISRESLIRVGGRYDTDTLTAERARVVTELRNRGYYYFRTEYLSYLADTTQQQYGVVIKSVLQDSIPLIAQKRYVIGNIDVHIASSTGQGAVDTLQFDGKRALPRNKNIVITYQEPKKVDWRYIRRNMTLQSGEIYSLSQARTTQNLLSSTGLFRYVNMTLQPVDSLLSDTINVKINLALSKPIVATFGVDLESKSNDFIGPELSFGVAQNNLFGGGETLALKLNGAYAWQTGTRAVSGGGLINSYEFGADVTLTFPRLLISRSNKRQRFRVKSTAFNIGADIENRPSYFKMLSTSTSMEYRFSPNNRSTHIITPFELIYNKLLNTTSSFDNTLNSNPALALSFSDQFIPKISYNYTFAKSFGVNESNKFVFSGNIAQAGNILEGCYLLFGNSASDNNIFGNVYSQFIKGGVEFKYSRRMWGENWIASRILTAAGHAYGNSSVMPYSEQYYIGGANSIRAFAIRSVGPGSYCPTGDTDSDFFDQTGTFKVEANVEFRFRIIGNLHTAIFLDAGNIWLLESDPLRPGGALKDTKFFKDLALGTGFGLRYDVSVLILRADLGIGLHAPYNNSITPKYYNITKFADGLGFHIAIGYPF